MKKWYFKEKVYREYVVLAIGPFEELGPWLKDCTFKDADSLQSGNAGYLVPLNSENTTNGNNCIIIWLKEWNTGCLVHELSHLTMRVFEDKGVPICNENTEHFAYYLEYWFRRICAAYKRHPNGRDRRSADN